MLAATCAHLWAGPWAGPWFLVFPLLWLAVIVTVAFLVRRRGRWHTPSGEGVLAERFARGEISEDEYRQRLAVLRGGGR